MTTYLNSQFEVVQSLDECIVDEVGDIVYGG